MMGAQPLSLVEAEMAQEDRFRMALERFVACAHGRAVAVESWRRDASQLAVTGVFPVELLHVSLRHGEEMTLFVKQLGSEQADHPDKQCRDRESRVYEELLIGDGLPVPRYYGSRRNEMTRRRELYLEYIGDWSLKYQDLDVWFPAARRLAHLHAHFAGCAADLSARDFLLRLDVSYFHGWAERALAVVAAQSEVLAALLREVVARYDRTAEMLAQQPATLVHNDLAPKNVLADRAQDPVRICFIDWEMAGVGCGLLDLVHLKDGLDPVSDRAMCTAYCSELGGTGLLPSSESALRRLFAACELHLILHRIASSPLWRPPLDRLAQWVTDARDLLERV
jgi:hypothetical protein